MQQSVRSIRSAYEYIKKELNGIYSEREIYSLIYLILGNVLKIRRHEIMLDPSLTITPGQLTLIQKMLMRLKTGEPVQHILGYAEFYGLRLKVTPDVLIPRPETEELVRWVLESTGMQEPVIIDAGTGSGCIALALKKERPSARITGTDHSEAALKVARLNARRLALDITLIRHDILNEKWPFSDSSVDILVSNPPYVPAGESKDLEKRVSLYEPPAALFVPDKDPLLYYRTIAENAMPCMKRQGLVFFEINEVLGEETVELLAERGYSEVSLRKDINGRQRMISARRQ